MDIYGNRIKKLREHMEKNNWDAVYIGAGSDLQYLVGVQRGMNHLTEHNMHGEEVYGAFIGLDKVIFVIPQLAIVASEWGSPIDDKPHITDQILLTDDLTSLNVAKQVLGMLGNPKTVAMNARGWVRSAQVLKEAQPQLHICDGGHVLSLMRSIKDEFELVQMRGAGKLTDIVFGEVVKRMRIGITELEIMEELRYQCFINGGSGLSFHPSASVRGEAVPPLFHNGGFPRTVLVPGAVVSFDFGVIYNGYASDFGRTVFVGEPKAEYVKYHQAVMECQKLAIDGMKSGQITAAQLDYNAHQYMENVGYGHLFIHRLGHGVGIDVHESPFAYPGDDTVLQTGMTLAIEPSCYAPRVIGVRVEDVVLVTEKGGETLSNFSRGLLVI